MKQQTQTVQVPQADMVWYFDRLFPRELPRASLTDPEDCAIEEKHVYVLGDMGSGKSNACKLFVNEAIGRYGSENVFCLRGRAEEFPAMLAAPWPKRLCVILICEDTVGVPVPDSVVKDFFRVRHVMMTKTQQREGLILVLFTSHRLHQNLLSLRASYTGLVILSVPQNDWDFAFIRGKTGGRDKDGSCTALQLLEDSEEKMERGTALFTYRRKFLGATKIPRLNFVAPVGDIGRTKPDLVTKQFSSPGSLLSRLPLPHLGHRTPQPVKDPTQKPVEQKETKRRFCPRCGQEVGNTGQCGRC